MIYDTWKILNGHKNLQTKAVTHPDEQYEDAEGQEEEVAQHEAHHPEDGESYADELILTVGSCEEIPWLQDKEHKTKNNQTNDKRWSNNEVIHNT